jgi:3-methyladenine DNA glycosylase AlkD
MTSPTSNAVLAQLRALASPSKAEGVARFGVHAQKMLGISMPVLRGVASSHRRDHSLALELWESGFHEARILAALVEDPQEVSEHQMEKWADDFDSWDVCDQVCASKSI